MIKSWRVPKVTRFFPSALTEEVAFKPSDSIRTYCWIVLPVYLLGSLISGVISIAVILYLCLQHRLPGIELKYLMAVPVNIGFLFLTFHCFRVLFTPKYQLLTLTKSNLSIIRFYNKIESYNWADIEKFELVAGYRSLHIWLKLKSENNLMFLTICAYPGLEQDELLDILNLWLATYGQVEAYQSPQPLCG